MDQIGNLLNALAAIPALAQLVEKIAASVSVWYIDRMTAGNIQEIIDAAAFAARAKTPADRSEALDRWRHALSNPRILP